MSSMDGVWFKLGWPVGINSWKAFFRNPGFIERHVEGDAGVALFGGSCEWSPPGVPLLQDMDTSWTRKWTSVHACSLLVIAHACLEWTMIGVMIRWKLRNHHLDVQDAHEHVEQAAETKGLGDDGWCNAEKKSDCFWVRSCKKKDKGSCDGEKNCKWCSHGLLKCGEPKCK